MIRSLSTGPSPAVVRFDLRALTAIIIGVAAIMAVARFDWLFAYLLAGPLGILWIVCVTSLWINPQRRVHALAGGLAGALIGCLFSLAMQLVVWGGSRSTQSFVAVSASTSVAALATLIGAGFGMLTGRQRRPLYRAVGALAAMIMLIFSLLYVWHRDELWALGPTPTSVRFRYRGSCQATNTDPAIVRWLRQLFGVSYVRYLEIDLDQVPDSIRHITGLKNLEWLRLRGPVLRGEDLKQLAGLAHLKSLDLEVDEIEDGAWSQMAEIPNVEDIDVVVRDGTGKPLTTDQVDSLLQSRSLRFLELDGVEVSEADSDRLRQGIGLVILHGTP